MDQTRPRAFRRDGWTPARQLAFLGALAGTRSISAAARAAGMSRESAYRLRRRPSAALFAGDWDRILAAPRPRVPRARAPSTHEGHSPLRFGSAWAAEEMAVFRDCQQRSQSERTPDSIRSARPGRAV